MATPNRASSVFMASLYQAAREGEANGAASSAWPSRMTQREPCGGTASLVRVAFWVTVQPFVSEPWIEAMMVLSFSVALPCVNVTLTLDPWRATAQGAPGASVAESLLAPPTGHSRPHVGDIVKLAPDVSSAMLTVPPRAVEVDDPLQLST